jgi:hypothetical protein
VVVRIAWLAAILVGVLAILLGLLSGGGGDPSREQAASAPGFAFEAQQKTESAEAAAPRDDRNQRAKGQILVGSRPGSDAPSGSAGPPDDTGGGAPEVTPQPAPTPAPPQVPVSSQPAPPEPVQPPVIVANNNDGP